MRKEPGKTIFRFLLLICCMGMMLPLKAQPTRKADRWFEQGAYYKALNEYCRLLSGISRLPEQAYIEFRAGVCCMRMNRYHHAVEWLEKAEKDNYSGMDLWRQLGEVYLIRGEYVRAKPYFERCLKSYPDDPLLNVKIASCHFGLSVPAVVPEVRITSLPYLNTRGSEYGIVFFPGGLLYSSTGDLLPEKEGEISQRTGLGYSRPYLSLYRDGEYQPGQLLEGIMKQQSNDGAFGYDWTSEQLYCTRCEEGETGCRIVFARLKKNSYRQCGELRSGNRFCNIAHPFVTEDGKRIYFSSTMSGGFGGADIWYMDRRPDGKWGEPQNAGLVVNTVGNEVFPYVHGNNFYFASDGRVGYGGLDIFYCTVRPDGFGEVRNMGPGINTSYDDFNLVLNPDGQSGLLVSNRLPDRSDDIYRFEKIPTLPKDSVVFISSLLDTTAEETEWKVVADISGRTYRMEVASGDVTAAGWWVQIAMLMKSKVIGYELASRVTELTGKKVVMFRGKDGGHRFYIGVYLTDHEARKDMVTLRLAGIDCFVKRVMSE